MGDTRYLWGRSKMNKIYVLDYIDFKPQASAPTASSGRMYMDDKYVIQVCADGTTWASLWHMVNTANPPWIRRGALYLHAADSNGLSKLKICEDGSTYRTVTTG